METSKSLFFGSLPSDMTEDELKNDFLNAFNIISVKLGVPKKGPQNTKYAFIEFASREEAKEAFEKSSGAVWREQNILVDWDIGSSRKQEMNKRSGYGQRDRGGYRGSRGRGRGRGGYNPRSGKVGSGYNYRGNRYSPYGGGRSSYRDDSRHGSYGDDYKYPDSHQRYSRDYNHRDDHPRYQERYSDYPHDYDRYNSGDYSHSQDYHPPSPRGHRDQGYHQRNYGYSHSRDYNDSGRNYPSEGGYEYSGRDENVYDR